MKLIKIKLATALVLGVVMFGMFSFTTTRVAGQDTSSNVAVDETDPENKGLILVLARVFVRALVAGVAFALAKPTLAASEYPADALD